MMETINHAFALDVERGLSGNPKHLSSRYFYDDRGTRIFKKIMELPEYYPTRCELEIISQYGNQMAEEVHHKDKLLIIELGAGDGSKTRVLLEHFHHARQPFTYIPLDISSEALKLLRENILRQFPEFDIQPLQGDYFQSMEKLLSRKERKLVLFLGSNIGNFTPEQAIQFTRTISEYLQKDDWLLMGFDLIKNPRIIRRAYDDPVGLTSAFNKNLLVRINRELQANFDTDKFEFYPVYNPLDGLVKSFLISTIRQTVHIKALKRTFPFEQWEPIQTEISRKFSKAGIKTLAEKSNFTIHREYYDCKHWFADVLMTRS